MSPLEVGSLRTCTVAERLIRVCPPEDQKVVIDLSDWDDSDDAGIYLQLLSHPFHLTRAAADDEMETNEEAHGPLRMFRGSVPRVWYRL